MGTTRKYLRPGEYTSDDLDNIVREEGRRMYGGAEFNWQRDADAELNPCEVCAEPGELYMGGHTYCPEHADKAGRNGYR